MPRSRSFALLLIAYDRFHSAWAISLVRASPAPLTPTASRSALATTPASGSSRGATSRSSGTGADEQMRRTGESGPVSTGLDSPRRVLRSLVQPVRRCHATAPLDPGPPCLARFGWDSSRDSEVGLPCLAVAGYTVVPQRSQRTPSLEGSPECSVVAGEGLASRPPRWAARPPAEAARPRRYKTPFEKEACPETVDPQPRSQTREEVPCQGGPRSRTRRVTPGSVGRIS